VRLALHPNDPPFPTSRGSQQIMATLAAETPDRVCGQPGDGITFDCGVTKEWAKILSKLPVTSAPAPHNQGTPNPSLVKPYVKYDEGFIDEAM